MVDGEQYGETRDGDGNGEDDKEETMLDQIAEVGDDEREDKGGCPGRHRMELCADLRVAVAPDDAGGKEGIAVGRDDEAEVHEAAQDDLEILEDIQYVPSGNASFNGRFALVLL